MRAKALFPNRPLFFSFIFSLKTANRGSDACGGQSVYNGGERGRWTIAGSLESWSRAGASFLPGLLSCVLVWRPAAVCSGGGPHPGDVQLFPLAAMMDKFPNSATDISSYPMPCFFLRTLPIWKLLLKTALKLFLWNGIKLPDLRLRSVIVGELAIHSLMNDLYTCGFNRNACSFNWMKLMILECGK